VLDDAVHDKGEESGTGATHGDKGCGTLCTSPLTAETNGKDKGVYGPLEEIKEHNGNDKEVRVGWTDNHREKSKDEAASNAGGEDGTRSGETGAVYGEICKACCHKSRHSKGGMRNEEIIGYREGDSGRFIGVRGIAGTVSGFLAGVGCIGKYGYHETAEVYAKTLLGSNVCVLSNDGQDQTPGAQLQTASLLLGVHREVLCRLLELTVAHFRERHVIEEET
jgi:hypothetical protein